MNARVLKVQFPKNEPKTPHLEVVGGKAHDNEMARAAVAQLEVHAPVSREPSNMEPLSEDLKAQQKIPQNDASIFSSAFTTFCLR